MIIFLFFLTWATTFSLLMFFSGLSYWFAYLKDDFIICEEIDIVGFETIDKES